MNTNHSTGPAPRTAVHHWRKTRNVATALVAAGALVLTGCTTSGSGGSEDPAASGDAPSGGTFKVGIGVDLDTLDPAQQTTTTVQNVVDYGLQTLIKLDKEGKVAPQLAESWETSEDGKVLMLKLRDDVKFHDGTDFNATAAKFSLDRVIDEKIKVPIGGAFTVIDSVDAPDATTLNINLKYPDPNLLNNLGITTSAIISPDSATKDGNTYENIVTPVGTGPYEFVKFQKGTQLTYEKYDDYWGEKPYYNEVVFRIIPEANSREAGLRSGQLQMIMNPPVTDLKAIDESPDLTTLNAPSDRSIFVALNVGRAPFDDVQVRKALNYAVNKEAIIKGVLFDTVDIMDSPLPSSVNGYCKVGEYKYDPTKAKKLLKDAGATNLSVTLGAPTGRYLQDQEAAQAIATNLRDVGVKVKVATTDWPSYQSTMQDPKGPWDMHMLGWAPGALDAPTQFQMFQKASWPPKGLGTAFYTNPKVETLVSEGSKELDETKRNDKYCQAQELIWDDAPWLYLWSQTLSLAYQSDIDGISYIPNEKFDTIYAKPAK